MLNSAYLVACRFQTGIRLSDLLLFYTRVASVPTRVQTPSVYYGFQLDSSFALGMTD